MGERIMEKKSEETGTMTAFQEGLRYGVDEKLAKRICGFNRHYAEHSGYFMETTWKKEVEKASEPVTYYDPADGKPLFCGPKGRTFAEFLKESQAHGWPSFRDSEVVWENVR